MDLKRIVVFADGFLTEYKTKKGILRVLEIQGENAKKMSIQDFLRGNRIQEYEIFE